LSSSARILHVSLTFALPARTEVFLAGFPRSSLSGADRDVQTGVVETYPLEPPTAKLR
jgi:hypothetical protein